MSITSPRSAYWRGVRDGTPFVFVAAPFAVLFGVVATEAGLNILQTLGFSVLVIAGASQFAAVQLMNDTAPTLVVLATALAVNMRMAMYSAALTPHLGQAPLWWRAILAYFTIDQTFAVSQPIYEANPKMGLSARIAYFMGAVTPVCPTWYVMTVVGALVGEKIPPEYALDFAVPITFLALIGPMLRTPAHIAAALTSIILALGLAFLPFNLGLILAGVAAMMAGAAVEHRMEGRA